MIFVRCGRLSCPCNRTRSYHIRSAIMIEQAHVTLCVRGVVVSKVDNGRNGSGAFEHVAAALLNHMRSRKAAIRLCDCKK